MTAPGVVVAGRAPPSVGDRDCLPLASPEPVLALGGYLRACVCLARGGEALLSPVIGDLDREAARRRHARAAEHLEQAARTRARVIAVDLHPDYPSTWAGEALAARRGGRLLRIQHHLAHAAAVLGEHGAFPARGECVGAIVLDGTGFGMDGTAWGAEWLTLDGELRWARRAHATALPLVGGERAVREPWRVACAALAHVHDAELLPLSPLARLVDGERLLTVARLSRAPGAWPRASGAGRFFEAGGALLGLGARNAHEGETAMLLERLASRAAERVAPWREIELDEERGELPVARILAAALQRHLDGEPAHAVAAGVHATFSELAAELALRALPRGVARVALAGGCLVNQRLARGLVSALERRGFEPLLPRRRPAGDAGLSFGQAVLAAVSLARGREPCFEGGA